MIVFYSIIIIFGLLLLSIIYLIIDIIILDKRYKKLQKEIKKETLRI
jgi:hypothetical protein